MAPKIEFDIALKQARSILRAGRPAIPALQLLDQRCPKAAKVPDGVVLYTLRHCWISDAIVGGMDLLTVAKLSGTSLAMIEKHYGHLVQGVARDKLATVEFL